MAQKTWVVALILAAAFSLSYFLYTWRANSTHSPNHIQQVTEKSKVATDTEPSIDPLPHAIACVNQGATGKITVRKITETSEIRLEPSPENQAFMKAVAVIGKHRDPKALPALVKSVHYLDQTATCKDTGDWGSSPAIGEYYPVPALLVQYGEAAVPYIMNAVASASEMELETDEGRSRDGYLLGVLGCILADKAQLAFEDAIIRTEDKLAQERLAKAKQRFVVSGCSKLPRNFFCGA